MNNTFKDHFSDVPRQYREYRPQYPESLFQYLASLTQQHECAWDCATGTGQAAARLAGYYSQVVATDASDAQIKNAAVQDGVIYRKALAENSGIASCSVDLVTVAQALHWFNIEAFGEEAGRVLKPGGVVAAWTYGMTRVDPAVDATIDYLYEPILGPYWPAERKMIESGYQDISLPFEEIHPPGFEMSHQWNLHQLSGYLKTWSAVGYYQRKHGVNPVDIHYNQLAERWGDPERLRQINWPLTVKIWRKPVD